MFDTLTVSFRLKNTYRTNAIIYSLKQVPLLSRLLPEALYGKNGLKVFSSVLSVLWEIVMTFSGKFLYFIFIFYFFIC